MQVDTDQRPFVLIWELTQACDLACKHCRADAIDERHPDELTTEEAKRFLEDVSEFGEGQLLVLSGGDPVYRDDTLELIEHGRACGLRITITPSGTNSLTPSMVDGLAETGIRRMALSFDGAAAGAHDGFREEEGSFEQTIRAAKAAQEADIPLQINTTVCRETVDELPQLSELVEQLEAVLWSVFFLVPVGRGMAIDPLSPWEAEDVMVWLAELEETAPFGIKTTEAPQYRRVRAQQQTGPHAAATDGIGRSTGIIAGDGFAFVSHLGEVYPSGFLPRSVGNVRDTSIVELYRNTPLMRSLRDRDSLVGKCGRCEFRYLCGGSRSRAYAYTGDPLESDPLCPYRPDGFTGELPKQHFSFDLPESTG